MIFCSCHEASNHAICGAQDFLESCRAPTLLAELEDDDELPEPDDEENDDDENEDDDDYEEVMVSRTLLALMVFAPLFSLMLYCVPVLPLSLLH